jgi:hypothetical protein
VYLEYWGSQSNEEGGMSDAADIEMFNKLSGIKKIIKKQ